MKQTDLDKTLPDAYVDQFGVSLNAYGATVDFQQSMPKGHAVDVMTVRMSIEHLKAFVVIAHRVIRAHEQQVKVTYALPIQVLNEMKVKEEDWVAYWGSQPS